MLDHHQQQANLGNVTFLNLFDLFIIMLPINIYSFVIN